jgi:multidrug efflux pump subunit AcrA (membrane-fusion protein)
MVKKILKSKAFYGALVVLAIIIAVSIISKKETDKSNIEVVEEVISAEASIGDMDFTISYGGTIDDNLVTTLSLAGDITVSEWQVSAGDYVEAGQLLATIDKNSALAAIAELNDLMENLDAAIETSRSDTIDSIITAPADGRIMAIYAESGNSVVDTMYNNSALMLMSIDGRLAVDIESSELSRGDSVTVVRPDGTEITGTVLQSTEGVATITVSDDSADYQEEVTILNTQGKELGRGELYIHSQLKVTGYSGTIDYLYVSVGTEVSQGQSLIYLQDTGYSGEYDRLITQRHKLENQMQDLYAAWQTGGLCAKESGSVTELIAADQSANTLANAGSGYVVSFLSEVNNIDESPTPTDTPNDENGAPEKQDTGTKVLAQVTAVESKDDGTIAFTLSTGSVISSEDLDGKTGTVQISDIKVGDVLVLNYSESSELTSVTVYQSSAQNGEGMDNMDNSGMMSDMSGMTGDGSANGGMSSGASGADTTQATVSYTMDETQLCSFSAYDTADIDLTVDELDISNISLGQSVTVTLDALPGESFSGNVTSIDPEGSNSGGNSKYTVTVSLERDQRMLTGMNATVTIELDKLENVLTVPLAAIQEDESGVYVYTKYTKKSDEFSSPVYVTTGASDGENVEIIDGLSYGDTVYYRYSSGLKYTFNR